jgi:Poly(ADP-ribose) polymerase and DNA-Ligase Zn-finger region
MANVIEEAKSGRASCRTCKKAIAKGDLRFGEEAPNAFGDTPSMRWHHMMCAAEKLPTELKAVLDSFTGDVPNRADIDQAMADAIAKGKAKPGGFPYVDRAPTGRAKCMQCGEPIAKDSFRVAVEREIDTGSMVTRGAGYMHPKCVVENLGNAGGSKDDLLTGLRANSRLPPADLDSVLAQIQ